MSKEYEGQDPLVLAQQAERDLNSYQAKQGLPQSSKAGDSSTSPSPLPFQFPKIKITQINPPRPL